jgi:CelD/BcsL family acetyltransferase involved in cellulose biosynthesis
MSNTLSMPSARDAYIKDASKLTPDEIAAWEAFSRADAHHASPFLSPHFARAIGEAGADARVCVVRDDGRIAAFFPYLYAGAWSRRCGLAERIGGEMGDSFGLIAAPGFRTTPRELLKLAKINYLNFSHLEEAQLRYGLTAEKPRIGLRTRLDSSAMPALASVATVTKKYLKDSERRQRKLAEEVGPITFQFDVEHDRKGALERLIEKKRAQYQSGGVPDALKEAWKRNALLRLADYRFDTCRGVLSTMFAGDQWLASHFGIMGNGRLNFWFPVYNAAFAQYAPGRLLVHHIIESCREQNFDTIDRGEGDTPIKREIANEEYQLYRGIWQNGSGMSRVIHGVNRLKWRFGR